jgi:PAS domain S-box-containing protein
MNPTENYLKKELYSLLKHDSSIFEFLEEGLLDGLWYWDLENPENEWMSPSFWTTLGIDPKTKKHKAEEWQDLIHPDDLKTAIDNFEKHCADPSHPYDQVVRYKHKNKSTVWVRCRGIAIRDDNGKPIRMLGSHTDVTLQKESEERFSAESNELSAIYEHAPMLMLLIDENGKTAKANQFALKYSDFVEKEPLGNTFGKTLNCLYMDKFGNNCGEGPICRKCPINQALTECLQNSQPSEISNIKFNQKSKEKEKIIYFNVSITPINQLDKKYALVCMHDVSNEIEAEKQKQKESERTENILRATNAGTWDWYIQTDELYLNLRWAKMLGYELKELQPSSSETWKTLIHPDDLEKVMKILELHLTKQTEMYDAVFRMKHKSGNWIWINARGKVTEWKADGTASRMSGTHLDITDRQLAEQSFEALYQGTSKAMGDEFFEDLVLCMSECFKMQYVFVGKLLPNRRIQTVSLCVEGLIHENIQYDLKDTPCENVVDKNSCVYPDYVQSLFPKDNLLVAMGVNSYMGTPLKDAVGNIVGLLVLMDSKPIHDTSLLIRTMEIFAARAGAELGRQSAEINRKALEDEHKLLETQLRQSEKMQAIGQLAGGIAHDFNNQLTGIIGYGEILCSKITDPALKEYADRVLSCALKSADLTKQLLAFSRKGNYQSIPVDMHQLIHEVISILSHSIDKRINIETQLDSNDFVIMGDPSLLQNAILNLGINSRDAMENGGTLRFESQKVKINQSKCNELPEEDLTPGDFFCLKIIDSGAGMQEDILDKIFEPFFTTKGEGKGTGMGLPAVHGTILQHKGFIEVESKVNTGTCFNVYLPLSKKSQFDPLMNDEKPVKGTGTILLVDDEQMVRQLGKKLLEDLGYEVVLATNGEEAVTLYNNIWNTVDLVIFDMIMPKLNGHDTFVAMKKINPDVKGIICSGFGVDNQIRGTLVNGAKAFIQKPFKKLNLSKTVAEVIKG